MQEKSRLIEAEKRRQARLDRMARIKASIKKMDPVELKKGVDAALAKKKAKKKRNEDTE